MYRVLLMIHVAAGAVALVGGLIAILAAKGKRRHTISGTWFFLSMYLVAASAVVMTLLRWNPFLLSIGLFSAYLTYSGRQAIKYWRLKAKYRPGLSDKLPVLLAFVVASLMIGLPVYRMVIAETVSLSIMMVFGCILLVGSIGDFAMLQKADNFYPRNKAWLFRHIGMMGGAYISTVTAFLVVNIKGGMPLWVPWLMPTVAGSFLIALAIRKWKIKLKA